jgi:hypothetical protein
MSSRVSESLSQILNYFFGWVAPTENTPPPTESSQLAFDFRDRQFAEH